MKEIELKILNVDGAKLRRGLRKLGARRLFPPVLVREVFLEQAGVPVEGRGYSSFRLRSVGKTCELTVKVRKTDKRYSVHDEFEVNVSGFEETLKLLTVLGFQVFRRREKVREEWKLGGVKVEIDEYPKMLPYMEIEGRSREAVGRFLKSLGMSAEHATNATATEIMRGAGLDPDNLVFKKTPPTRARTAAPSL